MSQELDDLTAEVTANTDAEASAALLLGQLHDLLVAAGTDPGIIPERFVIGAARFALERRLARPGVITTNFYKALASG